MATEIITVLSSDISILSSVAVSRLLHTSINDPSPSELYPEEDYKILVSVPDDNMAQHTGHISKYTCLSDLIYLIDSRLSIRFLREGITELSSSRSYNRPTELGDNGMTISCQTENPYIISSISETENGNISSIGGYRLSSGMNSVFKDTTFDVIRSLSIETYGENGNVIYVSPYGTKEQQILDGSIYVCQDDYDIETCVSSIGSSGNGKIIVD